jgi:hypothetical protein
MGARIADVVGIAETLGAATPARAHSVALALHRALALANARDAPLPSARTREHMTTRRRVTPHSSRLDVHHVVFRRLTRGDQARAIERTICHVL